MPNNFPSKGQPLPPNLQHKYGSEFGADLSKVTLHESHVPTLMGAEAYTRGSEIHFQPGGYDPYSDEGGKLLSHELAHVVQQECGNPSGNKTVADSFEQQAQSVADRVASWFD